MKKYCTYLLNLTFLVLFISSVTIAATLKTGVVKLKQEPVYNYIPAEITSRTDATILSKIPGFVENLKVDIGDKVKKGDILLSIDQNTSKQNIQEAYANVSKAKAQLKNAEFNYKRYSKLYKNKVISQQQFLKIKTDYKTALSAYKQAVAGLKTSQSALKYSIIKSPIDGIVSQKYVNNGDITSMFQPLIKISRTNALQVIANIDEKTLNSINSLGYIKVEIKDKTVNIKVSHIAPALDSAARTLTIKADLPNTIHAKPGEFAYVIVKEKTKPVIVVHKDAITTHGGIKGVFVVDQNNKAYFRMVRVGNSHNNYTEILSGLLPNEKVVLNPPLSLKNESVISDEKQ